MSSSDSVSPSPPFSLFTTLRYDPLLSSTSQAHAPHESSRFPYTLHSYYMLDHHHKRLLAAASAFHWPAAVEALSPPSTESTAESHPYDTLLQKLHAATATKQAPLRIKILLDHAGILTVETAPAPHVDSGNLYPSRLPPPLSHSAPPVSVSPRTGGALVLGASERLPGDADRSDPWDIVLDSRPTATGIFTGCKTTERGVYDEARERAGIGGTGRKEVLLWDEEGDVMEGSLTSVYFWRGEGWVTPLVGGEGGRWLGQRGTTRRWALERGLCTEGRVGRGSLRDGEEIWVSNGVRGFVFGRVRVELDGKRV